MSLEYSDIDRGGLFHFGNRENPEVLVKVIDACDVNDRFWAFYSAATTVGFTLTVEDVVAQRVKTYVNPDRTPALTVSDTRAFDTCP